MWKRILRIVEDDGRPGCVAEDGFHMTDKLLAYLLAIGHIAYIGIFPDTFALFRPKISRENTAIYSREIFILENISFHEP